MRRCAVICAEAVWSRCHRRIIADYLVIGDEQVFHILGTGKVAIARLTPGARPGPRDTVTYPPPPFVQRSAVNDSMPAKKTTADG